MKDDPKPYNPATEQHWDDIKDIRPNSYERAVPKYGESDLGLSLQYIKFVHDDPTTSALYMGGKTTGIWKAGKSSDLPLPVLYPIDPHGTPDDKSGFTVILGFAADQAGTYTVWADGGGRLGAVKPFSVVFDSAGMQEVAVSLNHAFFKVCISSAVWIWSAKSAIGGGGYNKIQEKTNPGKCLNVLYIQLYLTFGAPYIPNSVDVGPILDVAIPPLLAISAQNPVTALTALCQAIFPSAPGEIGLFKAQYQAGASKFAEWPKPLNAKMNGSPYEGNPLVIKLTLLLAHINGDWKVNGLAQCDSASFNGGFAIMARALGLPMNVAFVPEFIAWPVRTNGYVGFLSSVPNKYQSVTSDFIYVTSWQDAISRYEKTGHFICTSSLADKNGFIPQTALLYDVTFAVNGLPKLGAGFQPPDPAKFQPLFVFGIERGLCFFRIVEAVNLGGYLSGIFELKLV